MCIEFEDGWTAIEIDAIVRSRGTVNLFPRTQVTRVGGSNVPISEPRMFENPENV